MRNLIYILIILSTAFLYSCEVELFGCLESEGDVVRETISLPTISKIELGIDGELIIKEGDGQKIEIEATQNVIDRIINDSETNSDKWEININGCSNTGTVKIYATLFALESLDISANGVIKTDGVFNNINKINLEIDGDGVMDIKLATVEKVDIEINGSGDINVTGNCKEESIDINGDGTIHAFDLISQNSHVEINGNGNVDLFSDGFLRIDFSGSGSVCYKGMPTLNVNISGSGLVNDCN